MQYGHAMVTGTPSWTPIAGGSFVQAGTMVCTMQDKARESFSVKDFSGVVVDMRHNR